MTNLAGESGWAAESASAASGWAAELYLWDSQIKRRDKRGKSFGWFMEGKSGPKKWSGLEEPPGAAWDSQEFPGIPDCADFFGENSIFAENNFVWNSLIRPERKTLIYGDRSHHLMVLRIIPGRSQDNPRIILKLRDGEVLRKRVSSDSLKSC